VDVLNTTGGGVSSGQTVGVVLAGLVAIAFIAVVVVGIKLREATPVVLGILCALWFGFIAVVAYSERMEPIRHEVTLREGYVIDAAKYEIIKQRGRIYVIEERKEAAK
jgi:hypothetical protein